MFIVLQFSHSAASSSTARQICRRSRMELVHVLSYRSAVSYPPRDPEGNAPVDMEDNIIGAAGFIIP